MENSEVSSAKLKVLNQDIIKYIAMLTMLLNHIAHMFLTPGTVLYEVFEDVGVFTAPVMCFFLVEGYEYTSSRIKYGQRILLFAALSQIPYALASQKEGLNMIYTLLCCFMIIVVLDTIVSPAYKVTVCVLLVIATSVADWPLLAPVYTILFYRSRGNLGKMAVSCSIAYAAYMPFQIYNYLNSVYGDRIVIAVTHALLSGLGIIAAGVVLMFFYNGKRAKKGSNFSKWFFYIFYPAHLMVLYLIKVYII